MNAKKATVADTTNVDTAAAVNTKRPTVLAVLHPLSSLRKQKKVTMAATPTDCQNEVGQEDMATVTSPILQRRTVVPCSVRNIIITPRLFAI